MDNVEIVSPIMLLVKGKNREERSHIFSLSAVSINEVGSILAGMPQIRPFVMID